MPKLEQKTLPLRINWKIITIIFLLCLITFSTKYYGSTDVGDYSNIAKYFAGQHAAKIRSSHSYLYGTLHAPFIALFQNFFVFKLSSVIFLLLLVYSVYLATGKNKKSLWLILLSPIIWYMSPWINPIQLSALLFFWGYLAIKKFENTEKLKFLFFSGLLVGLSWAFWDAVLFFSIILAVSFIYNKKFYYFFLFFVFILAGLLPKLILDQFIFGFAFLGIIKYFSAIITSTFFGGIYGHMISSHLFIDIILILVFIPIFTYKLFLRENWSMNKKPVLFISLSLLLILKNTQVRYLLLLVPILILELAPKLTKRHFKKQIIISIILIFFIIAPYLIQIKYSTNAEEFSSFLLNINKIEIFDNQEKIIKKDINDIVKDFPNKTFVVGNSADDSQILASMYWGKNVKEFVSIEDYNLFIRNETGLFQKKFMPSPRSFERRQIWISGGINKNENDNTDYSSINLGIGIKEPIKLDDFSVIKKYNLLYVSKK